MSKARDHGYEPVTWMPHSTEAERGVIGSVLIEPRALTSVQEVGLRPEHFYHDAYRVIYQTMLKMEQERITPDFLTLTETLEKQCLLEQVGGSADLSYCVSELSLSYNAQSYARLIMSMYSLCELIKHGMDTAREAAQPGADPAEILARAEGNLYRLAHQLNPSGEFQEMSYLVEAYFRKLEAAEARLATLTPEERAQGRGLIGIPTGFPSLDVISGGFQKTDLTILGAQPAVGKTALALNMAANAALRFGKHVAIASLEMGWEQIMARFFAMRARVDLQRLTNVVIYEDDWEHLARAMGELVQGAISLLDTGNLTIASLRSKCIRLKQVRGLDLLIVDYAQLLSGERDRRGGESRTTEMDGIARGLKALAMELDIPVLAMAQLSRKMNERADRVPHLGDLRESGGFEQNANVVLFLHREDVGERGYVTLGHPRQNQADIIVAKNRNGMVGEGTLMFEGPYVTFRELTEAEDAALALYREEQEQARREAVRERRGGNGYGRSSSSS